MGASSSRPARVHVFNVPSSSPSVSPTTPRPPRRPAAFKLGHTRQASPQSINSSELDRPQPVDSSELDRLDAVAHDAFAKARHELELAEAAQEKAKSLRRVVVVHDAGGNRLSSPERKRSSKLPYEIKQVKNDTINDRDKGTPDAWIPRHPELVRLTGRHPFNAEPPLDVSEMCGFITPTALHYVRNHGAVPKLDWDSHRLSIGGLVANKLTMSMDELVQRESIKFSMMMVCSGNRRKEHNVIKNTAGFHYGAGAACNTVWKGVPLRALLIEAGFNDAEAKFVHFEGCDSLPKCSGKGYATAIPIATAMDPAHDVIIAYEQNGERLMPDHGFPIRALVPGHTAGRSVKFLTTITVSDKDSDNYYHYYDNRVLPTLMEAEEAEAGRWYHNPSNIIYELNVQSVLTSPMHMQIEDIVGGKTIKVKGFAYNGGEPIKLVEVSADNGKTWEMANLTAEEVPNAYGKCWSWVWFELNMPIDKLWCGSTDDWKEKFLVCRAWDTMNQRQPEQPAWNIMGMMNNSWFKIKYELMCHPDTGLPAVKFLHPTMPGPGNLGGWKEERMGEASAKALRRAANTMVFLGRLRRKSKEARRSREAIANSSAYEIGKSLGMSG